MPLHTNPELLDNVQLPECYGEWREVPVSDHPADHYALLFDLTMSKDVPDALNVVTLQGKIIAVAHKGEHRWWVCDYPKKPSV